MHIVALIVAALGGLGLILWRIRMAADATRDIADVAGDVHGFFRRWKWRRNYAASNLDLVHDPREAAVAMAVALAQSNGVISERERRVIIAGIVRTLGARSDQAEELFAYGRWLTRDERDVSSCFRKLAPLIRRDCSPDQIRDLLALLEDIAIADGPAGDIEIDALRWLSSALPA